MEEKENNIPKGLIPINYNFSELKDFQDIQKRIMDKLDADKKHQHELYEKMKEKEEKIIKWNKEHKDEIEAKWKEDIKKNLEWLQNNLDKKEFLINLFKKNNSWGLFLDENDGFVHDSYGPMSRGRLVEPWIIFNRYKDD